MFRKLLGSFLFSKRQSSGITTIGTLTYLVVLLLGIVVGASLTKERISFWPKGEDSSWTAFPTVPAGFKEITIDLPGLQYAKIWQNPDRQKEYFFSADICRWPSYDYPYDISGWRMYFHHEPVLSERYPDYFDNDFIINSSVQPVVLDFEQDFGDKDCLDNELRLNVTMHDAWEGVNEAALLMLRACYTNSVTSGCFDQYIVLGELPLEATPTPAPEKVSARGRVVRAGETSVQISGAQVEVEGEAGVTDNYGLFLIPGVPKKASHPDVDYHVKVEKEGYQTLEEDRDPSGVLTNESTADFGEIGLTQLPSPTPLAKPDLTCPSITLNPSEPIVGQNVEIRFTVSNIGDARAEWHWEELYVDDQLIARPAFIFDLAPGESMEGGAGSWLATDGSHTVKVKIDATDRIKESNENNNERFETFTLCQKPLPPSDFKISESCSGEHVLLLFEWRDNSTNEDGFRVYAQFGGFYDSQISGDLFPNTTSYDELIPISTCQQRTMYSVASFNKCGESGRGAVTAPATDCCPTLTATAQVREGSSDGALIKEPNFRICNDKEQCVNLANGQYGPVIVTLPYDREDIATITLAEKPTHWRITGRWCMPSSRCSGDQPTDLSQINLQLIADDNLIYGWALERVLPTPIPSPPPPPPPPPSIGPCTPRNCQDVNPDWLDRIFWYKPGESNVYYANSSCTSAFTGIETYCTPLAAFPAADFNGDLEINSLDFGYLISGSGCWTSNFDSRTDFNNDGVCNAIDVSCFFSAWSLQSEIRK
jgi:hypothetical protein